MLIKKYNLLLEEKQLYKKKAIFLEKENKKLKEKIKINNKEEINEMIEIKKANKEIIKENEYLKNEINNLKKKLNEIEGNSNNFLIKEKSEANKTHLNYLKSFGSSIRGITMPTTERYIKNLEKENEELSNKVTKYKNLFKFTKNEYKI